MAGAAIRWSLAVALFAADAWLLLTVANAVTRSGGSGAVFWTAVGVLGLLEALLLWLTTRLVRARGD